MYVIPRFIAVISAVFFPAYLFSQPLDWEKVHSFPARVAIIYFYNTKLGFVGIGVPGGTTLTPAIYKTTDGGKSWVRTKTPTTPGNGVNDIFMEDEENGWAGSDNKAGRIWRTTDGGSSWNVVSGLNGASIINSIRRTKAGIVVSDFLGGSLELSTDEGKTFTTVYRGPEDDYFLGMDFVDSLHGAAASSFRSDNRWSYTTDGGISWQESNYRNESWTITPMQGTSMFYSAPEGYSNTDDYLTEIMRSDDYGKTWKRITTLPFRGTSDIEAAGGNLYVQSGDIGCTSCTYPEGRGVYRSTDSGMSWHGLGGPETWGDTRFAVASTCEEGTVLLCCDSKNNLYRAIDTSIANVKSMDGQKHLHMMHTDSIEIDPCHYVDLSATIRIDNCYELDLTEVYLENTDTSRFQLEDLGFPISINGASKRFRISFLPEADSGAYSGRLHLKGYYNYQGYGTKPFDTILLVKVIVNGGPRLKPDKGAVVFLSNDPCKEKHADSITLTNHGCDTLRIVSASQLRPPFLIDTLELPLVIPPNEYIKLHLGFFPDSMGTYLTMDTFIAESGGKKQLVVIPISGEKKGGVSKLSVTPMLLNFQSVFLCDTIKTLKLSLKNDGCEQVVIGTISQVLPEGFFMDSIGLPITIFPGQTIELPVYFHPNSTLSLQGTVTITLADKERQQFIVDVIGSGRANFPELTISNNEVVFSPTSLCNAYRDTTITLINTGCDSLTIESVAPLLPVEITIDKVALPVTIPPLASITVHAVFLPTQTTTITGIIEVLCRRFDASSSQVITISGSAYNDTAILNYKPALFLFPEMKLCSTLDSLEGVVSNLGCDSLVIDSINIAGEGELSLSSISLPRIIARGDTLRYNLYFKPAHKGDVRGKVSLSTHSKTETNRTVTTIPIEVRVKDGLRLLTVTPTKIDFGTTTLCDIRDTIVTVTNEGCDTVTISDLDISGTGYVLNSIATPIILPAGVSVALPITTLLDTVAHRTSSDASLRISTLNCDNVLPLISLHHGYRYADSYTVSLSGGIKTAKAGDTTILSLQMPGIARGISTLDLEMNYDADMLEFVGSTGPNDYLLSNGHLHIQGRPEITVDKGSLGELSFRAYLSKETSSSITISEPHFNTSEPGFENCIASIAVVGQPTIFTLSDECGSEIVSKRLQGNVSVVITTVYPNPTRDKLLLKVRSKVKEDCVYKITDALGRSVMEQQVELIAGDQEVECTVSKLPTGVYFLTAKSTTGSSTVQFIKER